MSAESPEQLSFSPSDEDAGERLDTTLAALSGVSRAQVRRWIEQGCVTVAGRARKPSYRLAVGEQVLARIPEPVALSLAAEAIPLAVVHEDPDLIVVNKPAGMVVHPAPGHASGTLVNALLHHCGDLAGVGGVLRPGIVHRLDRGTSGVMVAAKTDVAHVGLAQQFHDHSIHRVYVAFVRALPGADEGFIDRAIGRHSRDRKRMSVRTVSGREARTRWRVTERFASTGTARLEVRPETGRTHQIRVHLAWAGMPIVGDPVYGRVRRGQVPGDLQRPALHAAELGFTHPGSGEWMEFRVELPDDLVRLGHSLGGSGTRESPP